MECGGVLPTTEKLRNASKSSNFMLQLDVDSQRDDDASPMSSYGNMLRPT